MAKIFISYRRQDSAGVAGRIYDRLCAHFGKGAVFMDIDNIPFGVDFREHIDAAVGQCDVVLAVIGPRWVGKAFIRRRIDEPKDFVRVELESALRRNLPVIPILIDNAGMPGEADLPPSLTRLSFRTAIEVDHGRDFHLHIDRLIRGIDFHFQKLKRTPPDPPTSLKVQILGDRYVFPGRLLPPTAWVRSPMWSFASAVKLLNILAMEHGSQRLAPANLTTCMWRPVTRWRTLF